MVFKMYSARRKRKKGNFEKGRDPGSRSLGKSEGLDPDEFDEDEREELADLL